LILELRERVTEVVVWGAGLFGAEGGSGEEVGWFRVEEAGREAEGVLEEGQAELGGGEECRLAHEGVEETAPSAMTEDDECRVAVGRGDGAEENFTKGGGMSGFVHVGLERSSPTPGVGGGGAPFFAMGAGGEGAARVEVHAGWAGDERESFWIGGEVQAPWDFRALEGQALVGEAGWWVLFVDDAVDPGHFGEGQVRVDVQAEVMADSGHDDFGFEAHVVVEVRNESLGTGVVEGELGVVHGDVVRGHWWWSRGSNWISS
jgi:hypothetical protein